MKVLLLLFLVGCATAFVVQKLDNAVDQDYQELMLEFDRAEHQVKTELGKRLQKIFGYLLKKIDEEADKGKAVKEELIEKRKEVREKLKKLKELIEKMKEKSDDLWHYILGKQDTYKLFEKLKKKIIGKVDKEQLKDYVEELFGRGNEISDSLLEIINEKCEINKDKLLDFIDRYLKEVREKIKDYFKTLNIELKDKYRKFGEWVMETIKDKIEKRKSKVEIIRTITKEFLIHAENVSKEVAVEALEFLRPFRDDLLVLWDCVKDTVKEIIQKTD